MTPIRNKIFLAIVFVLTNIVWASDSGARVLYLNAYHRGYSWSDTSYKHFKERFLSQLPDSQIFHEYMDTKHFPYSDVKEPLKLLLSSKYLPGEFDLIVTGDDNAFRFVTEYYNELFNDIPVVFHGVNDYQPEQVLRTAGMAGRVTGIIEYTDYQRLYEIISGINPAVQKMMFLVDNTSTGQGTRSAIEQQMANMPEVEYEFVDGRYFTYDQVMESVKAVGSDTAVVSAIWFRDRENMMVEPEDFFRLLSKNCPEPVYATVSLKDYPGPTGSLIIDNVYMGQRTADMSLAILQGVSISDIPIEKVRYFKTEFDLGELSRRKINLSLLPSGANFVGEISYSEIEDYQSQPELASWEQVWLHNNPTVTVGVYNCPPLSIVRGQVSGYCVDYLKLIGESVGINFVFKPLGDSLTEYKSLVLADDDVDVVLFYEQVADWGDEIVSVFPWIKSQYALFIRVGEGLFVYNSLNTLEGTKIAVEQGSLAEEIISKHYPGIELVPVTSVVDGLNAVSVDKVFGFITGYSQGVYLARSYGLSDVEVVSEIYEFDSMSYSLGVKSDRSILAGILEKAYSNVPESEIIQLRNKYSVEQIDTFGISFLHFLVSVIVLTVLFSLVMIFMILRLKRLRDISHSERANLQTIFDSISDGFILTDSSGKIVRINAAAEKLTGWLAAEAESMTLAQVFRFSEKDSVVDFNQPEAIISSGCTESISGSGPLFSRDGTRYYISVGASLVAGKSDQTNGLVLVFRDKTHQYEVERALKQVEQECELILDNITVGVCFLDRNYRIVRVNRQMEKFMGKSAGEVVGQKCFSGWFGKSSLCEKCAAVEAIRTGHPCRGKSPIYIKGYDCDIVSIPVIENGELTGVLEILIDVSDYNKIRKELEAAYESLQSHSRELEDKVKVRSELLKERISKLVDTLEELKDAQGQLILSEKMAALGQLIAGIAHEINTPLGAIGSSGEIISNGILTMMDYLHELAGWLVGEHRELVSELLAMSLNNASEPVMSTRESRKHRKKISEELSQQNIQESDDIARFIVDMNIHNDWQRYMPIFTDVNCSLILYSISRIMDIMHSCATISAAVVKALRIVVALKNYIHSSEGQQLEKEEYCPVDIQQSLDTVLTLFHNKIKHSVELEKKIGDVPKVFGNSDQLNQVWTNLIQNSLYAMKHRGRLTIAAEVSDGGVEVSIADTGCGIAPEIMPRVFEPLFTTKPSGEGTGLGMDIVRKIVEDNHKGKIFLESELGKGTAVRVWLPLERTVETEGKK